MIKRIVLCTAFALAVLASAAADSGWEGSAVIGRYGTFPSEGYFGASNSFPRNSVVTVTNLQNRRSVDVIITGRVSEPGVFISLSRQAAAELAMQQTEPVRVRVRPLETVAVPAIVPDAAEAGPLSLDPDVNPFAAVDDQPLFTPYDPPAVRPDVAPEPAIATEPPVAPPTAPPTVVAAPREPSRGISSGVTRTAAAVPTARAEKGDEVGSVTAPSHVEPLLEIDPALAEQPFFETPVSVAETNRMQAALAEVRGRTLPRELHPPPRDEAVYTFLDVPRDLAIARDPDREPTHLPDDPAVRIAERRPAESLGRIEEPVRPLIAEVEPTEVPPIDPREENGLILRLEPAEPRPPEKPVEEAPAVEAPPRVPPAAPPEPDPRVSVDEWALARLPLVSDLEVSSYYLQVGAFASPRSAQNVIDRFESQGYPFTVTAVPREDRTLYRVYVGPLVRDETGIVLQQVRARGFRDAFVRRGGE